MGKLIKAVFSVLIIFTFSSYALADGSADQPLLKKDMQELVNVMSGSTVPGCFQKYPATEHSSEMEFFYFRPTNDASGDCISQLPPLGTSALKSALEDRKNHFYAVVVFNHDMKEKTQWAGKPIKVSDLIAMEGVDDGKLGYAYTKCYDSKKYPAGTSACKTSPFEVDLIKN